MPEAELPEKVELSTSTVPNTTDIPAAAYALADEELPRNALFSTISVPENTPPIAAAT